MIGNAPDRGRPTGRARGWAVAAVFFALGLLALSDFAITTDEPETLAAADGVVQALQARLGHAPPPPASPHELPGYYFVFDLVRGLAARAIGDANDVGSLVRAHHGVHLVLASLSVFLVWSVAARITALPREAALAAAALAMQPKFIAHSQANPKDLPALFAFTLAVAAFVHLAARGERRHSLAAGVALALALTTREISPLLVVIVVAWLALTDLGLLRRRVGPIAVALGLAAVGFFVLWPWLWTEPWRRLSWAIARVTTFREGPAVLYFGRVFEGTEVPWHYTFMSLVTTAPAAILLPAAVGLRDLFPRTSPGRRSLAVLAALWVALPLLTELAAPSHYDGIRHFLLVLPGVALLAGLGAGRLLDAARRWLAPPPASPLRKRALAVLVLLPVLHLAWEICRLHPYQDAYLNEPTRALLTAPPEEVFEVEYWGAPYREGATWLNRHAEPHSRTLLVWTEMANFHLSRPGVPAAGLNFEDPALPQYLMYTTRRAFYGEWLERLEREYVHVFEVKRGRATLLRILRNTRRTP